MHMDSDPDSASDPVPAVGELRSPAQARRIADRLLRDKEEREKRSIKLAKSFISSTLISASSIR